MYGLVATYSWQFEQFKFELCLLSFTTRVFFLPYVRECSPETSKQPIFSCHSNSVLIPSNCVERTGTETEYPTLRIWRTKTSPGTFIRMKQRSSTRNANRWVTGEQLRYHVRVSDVQVTVQRSNAFLLRMNRRLWKAVEFSSLNEFTRVYM
jgi:hypothetical protein